VADHGLVLEVVVGGGVAEGLERRGAVAVRGGNRPSDGGVAAIASTIEMGTRK